VVVVRIAVAVAGARRQFDRRSGRDRLGLRLWCRRRLRWRQRSRRRGRRSRCGRLRLGRRSRCGRHRLGLRRRRVRRRPRRGRGRLRRGRDRLRLRRGRSRLRYRRGRRRLRSSRGGLRLRRARCGLRRRRGCGRRHVRLGSLGVHAARRGALVRHGGRGRDVRRHHTGVGDRRGAPHRRDRVRKRHGGAVGPRLRPAAGRRGARAGQARPGSDAAVQVGDRDTDRIASLARGLPERDCLPPVDRPQPEVAEQDRDCGQRREDRCKAERAHTLMIADPADDYPAGIVPRSLDAITTFFPRCLAS
jgi:hypothetical protein